MPVEHETLTKTGKELKSLNKKKAIRLKCFNCSGWSQKDVKECKTTDCKLYPYRMSENPNSGVQRAKDIKSYCTWCLNTNVHDVKKCVDFSCPIWPFRRGSITDRSREGIVSITDEF